MTRPIYQTASATSDAAGNVTITIAPVPSSMVWTGSISVTNSPASTIWVIQAGLVPWGQTIGQAFGPIQCFQSTSVSVSTTGTTPNTVFNAVFVGREDGGDTVPQTPYPTATQISGTVQIAGTTQIAGVVSIASAIRRIGQIQLPSAATSGQFSVSNIAGAALTAADRYLYVQFQIGGAVTTSGLWLSTGTGGPSNFLYGIYDVSSRFRPGQIPLTGLDTDLAVNWQVLTGNTNTSTFVTLYGSAQPLPRQELTAEGFVSITGAATAVMTWPTLNNGVGPDACRLKSASIASNLSAASFGAILAINGVELVNGECPANGVQQAYADFGTPGLILANGSMLGAGSWNPRTDLKLQSFGAAGVTAVAHVSVDVLA